MTGNHIFKTFKPLKNVTKYHHFLFDAANPGQIQCKVKASSESVTFNLLRNKQNIPRSDKMPTILSGVGLDAARQWYLYEQIRDPVGVTYATCMTVSDLMWRLLLNAHSFIQNNRLCTL